MAGEQFTCTVYGRPQPAGSKVPGMRKDGTRFVRDANKNAAEWKRQVAQFAGIQMETRELEMFEGPVSLSLVFYLARPKGHYGTGRNEGVVKASAPEFPVVKPDLTKLVRGAEDGMRGIVYRDDSQVVVQTTQKVYGTPERVYIEVTALSEEGERGEGLGSNSAADSADRTVDEGDSADD